MSEYHKMLNWPDIVNGLFEVAGGAFAWVNVATLWRAKQVRGVSVAAWALFAAWGVWNLWYYPHLGQWASFFGGILIVTANIAWLWLAYRFRGN